MFENYVGISHHLNEHRLFVSVRADFRSLVRVFPTSHVEGCLAATPKTFEAHFSGRNVNF